MAEAALYYTALLPAAGTTLVKDRRLSRQIEWFTIPATLHAAETQATATGALAGVMTAMFMVPGWVGLLLL